MKTTCNNCKESFDVSINRATKSGIPITVCPLCGNEEPLKTEPGFLKLKNIKRFIETLEHMGADEETEVFIANSVNPCGNISELTRIECSTYGFFGKQIPCIILYTSANTKTEEV